MLTGKPTEMRRKPRRPAQTHTSPVCAIATLNWIGKEAVVGHHRKVPYRLLRCDQKLSAGDPDAGNLLVQGDNLEALKALLPYLWRQIKYTLNICSACVVLLCFQHEYKRTSP